MGWIIVHPSVPTVALAASLYVACAVCSRPAITVCSRTARTAHGRRPWAMLAFEAATFQNSALSWSDTIERITPTPTARVTPTRSPVGPGPPTSDGCRSTSGVRRRHLVDGPLGGAQHAAAAPLRPAVASGSDSAASDRRRTVGRPVGRAARGRVPTCRPSRLQATFCVNSLTRLIGTRRYDAPLLRRWTACSPPHHLRRGNITASITDSPSTTRHPRWCTTTREMADRTLAHRNGQRVANRLGRHHRQGRHAGARRGLHARSPARHRDA